MSLFIITISVILKNRNVILYLCFLTEKTIYYIACRFVKTIKFIWLLKYGQLNHKAYTKYIGPCGNTEVIAGNFSLEYCFTRPNS